MDFIKGCSENIVNYIEKYCEGLPAWKIITASAFTTYAFLWIKDILLQNES